jgi:hypothetical protein
VTWAQALVTIGQLLEGGETDAPAIAKRFGIKLDSLYLSLHRYGREDLWQRMTNRARQSSTSHGNQVVWAKAIPVIEKLLDQGATDTAVIAGQLGIRPKGIYSGLRRYRRLDLWERMTARWAGRPQQVSRRLDVLDEQQVSGGEQVEQGHDTPTDG